MLRRSFNLSLNFLPVDADQLATRRHLADQSPGCKVADCQSLLQCMGLESCLQICEQGKNLLSLSSSSTTFSVLPAFGLEEPLTAVDTALGGILTLGLRVFLTVVLTGLVVVLTVALMIALELVVRGTLIGVQPEDMSWSCRGAESKWLCSRFGFGDKGRRREYFGGREPSEGDRGRGYLNSRKSDRKLVSIVQPCTESSEFP